MKYLGCALRYFVISSHFSRWKRRLYSHLLLLIYEESGTSLTTTANDSVHVCVLVREKAMPLVLDLRVFRLLSKHAHLSLSSVPQRVLMFCGCSLSQFVYLCLFVLRVGNGLFLQSKDAASAHATHIISQMCNWPP